jgi:dipeptidyl aminopeptidase/acylaminoacyl peptidase
MSWLRRRSPIAFVPAIFCLLMAAVEAAPLSIADAFKPSLIESMRLSPDGRRILAFGWNDEATAAVVMDVDSTTARLLRSGLGGLPWTARWLGNGLVAVAMWDETHIFETGGKFFRRIGGRFVATLPDDARGHEQILVRSGWRDLERVDVRTGEATRIRTDWPDDRAGRWLMDHDGVPRVVTTRSDDQTMLTHWYRPSAEAPWQPIESQLAIDARWWPAALGHDGKSLIVYSSEGRDTLALFRYSLEEHALGEMLAGHPTEDVRGVDEKVAATDDDANEGAGGAYVRVVTMGMRLKTYWFDPQWAALQQSVDAALPGRTNVLSGNLSSGRLLVASSADVDPGTWYVLDVASHALKEIDSRKPEIDRKAMAPMEVVRYRSPDGLEIPAYLTLPPGGGRNLPAVVLVHGGPLLRDRWEWDPEVQMLASRGYAVLQPQFRGSAGFGKTFALAGYQQWGRGMQDDVTAGARWLAAQGIADARRICIYGASYGGFAALWGVVKTPELFRCAVSLAGVSDLALMFKDDSDVNENEFGRLFRLRTVGDPGADAKLFDEVSPMKGAARVQVPLLIAHGERDKRVPIVHSEKMVAALRANGKRFEWMPLPGEGHGFAHKESRERFYTAMFDFLARNTALRTPTPASASSAAALARDPQR